MISYFTRTLLLRSYTYLLLTFFSIAVGAFLLGGSVSITRSISNYFISEGRTLVGGDIVLSGNSPIDTSVDIFKNLDTNKVTLSSQYSLQAVFSTLYSSSTAPASIRVVEGNFPLYGEVLSEPAPFTLSPMGIYVEQGLLSALSVNVGDEVVLGNASYTIVGVLIKEPDTVAIGVSFTPKVLMRAQDFEASGIDVNQSRTAYKVLIKENEAGYLSTTLRQNIKDYTRANKLRFDDAIDGPNNFVRGLSSVKSFVGIVLAISLFLVVVNIITNLTYILTKFKKTIAIMKTFGATSLQIQIIYSLILGLIGLSAGAFGTLLGAVGANAALPYISSYTGNQIAGIDILPTTVFGALLGALVILASALPFFRSLNNVTAKQLLSNIGDSNGRRYLSYALYLPIPVVISLLLYLLSGDFKLVAYSMLALIGSFALFVAITYLIIFVLYRKRHSFPFIVSSVITSLAWRGFEAVIVISSIMTAFSGVFIVSTIEKNILANIQQNVSSNAPALYLVDITKSQIDDVQKIAGDTFTSYPIVRGRLLEVNGRDMTQVNDPGITREFNMTYRTNLLASEKILSGSWHGDSVQQAVSIDDSFAADIGGVAIGDTIKVFIQGLTVEATITSIRSSDRSSGTPFFYLVFSPDVISLFPASYFATTDAPDATIATIKNELGAKYPNIIPIDTKQILSTVSNLLDSVILALKVIGIPSIVLGFILVLVMTGQSIYERRGDVLIFRAFGLRSSAILKLFIIEIVTLIIIAGGVAYILAHAIAFALNTFLFSFDTFVFDYTPLPILLGLCVLVSGFAFLVARTLTTAPLRSLLSEK